MLAMDKEEYEYRIKQIQKLFQKNYLSEAKKEIYKLRKIYPYSLKYICENVELMLKNGKDINYCRTILDNICQEYYICKELIDIFHLKKDIYGTDSIEYKLCDFSEKLYAGHQQDKTYWADLNAKKSAFLSSNIDDKKAMLKELAEAYYIVRNMNMYVVLLMAWCYKNKKLQKNEQYIHEDAGQAFYGLHNVNLGYLTDLLKDSEAYTFVLIDDMDSLNQDIDILAAALQFMGNRTIIIRQPCVSTVAENEHVAYSMLNATTQDDSIIINPVVPKKYDKKSYWLHVSDIVQFLADNLDEKSALTVMAADSIMDELHDIKKHAKNFQRLSERRPAQFSYAMAFAWAGDYCKYMSYIYGFSVREKIENPAECDVSIVIPVRNSVDTLRYTLQTCLNQQTNANYEIVLSDNSDADNMAVHDLYIELNDNRIKYYHTPFVLNLSKSFEFAFLHARGRFITSIGADDGIYPWAVQAINESLPYMNESNILHWDRSFYAWPGFSVEQENMLTFTMFDNTEPFKLEKYGLRDSFFDIMYNLKDCLYRLPTCYINSGFKREFLQELLADTGRLWDSSNQDISTGATILMNNKYCYHLDMPLAIAGMSSHSIGALSGRTDSCFDELVQRINKYNRTLYSKGEYVARKSEYLVPRISGLLGDVVAFYRQIMRLQEFPLKYGNDVQRLDRKKVFLEALNLTSVKDVFFYLRIYNIYHSLEQKGNENCYKELNSDTISFEMLEGSSEEQAKEKVYQTRFNKENDSLCVNASDFNITNVKEAVDFISNMINIKVNC